MENLYDKIVSHIILKLKNGETELTKQDIARDMNITVNVLDIVCYKTLVSRILSGLSKNENSPEQINNFIDSLENTESKKTGNDFQGVRELIRRIEARALKKLNGPGSDDDIPDDAA